MNFIEQDIEGVYLILPEPFKDERGLLRRHFCREEFSKKKVVYRNKTNKYFRKYKYSWSINETQIISLWLNTC